VADNRVTGAIWVRVLKSAAVLGAAALMIIVPAISQAQTRQNPYAGNWSTNTGGLSLSVVDAATGSQTVQDMGIGTLACGNPTVWYVGSYSGSDSGRIVGCTKSAGSLEGFYKSSAGVRYGTIHILVGSDGTSFAGTYDELSDEGTGIGPYNGTFSGDFDGDGCCTTTSPAATVVTVPTPAAFNTTVSVPEPPPGGAANIVSPPLGVASQTTVDFAGLDPEDLAELAAGPHVCMTRLITLLSAMNRLLAQDIDDGFATEARLAFDARFMVAAPQFVQCVRFAKAVQAAAALANQATATPAQAGCAFTPVELSTTGSGATQRLRSIHVGPQPGVHVPLRVSCQSTATGLALTIASSSGGPLSAIVGPQLRLGVVRSLSDAAGGQLSVSFHQGTAAGSGGASANLAGSWTNPATPTAPPWVFTTTNKLHTLTATFAGGAGHTGLRGTVTATLQSNNTVYAGTVHITEGALSVGGTITITIVSQNKLEVSLKQTNLPNTQVFELDRG